MLGLQGADLARATRWSSSLTGAAVRAGRLALRRRSSARWLWCVFVAVAGRAGLIDWDTTLLPDDLTLPLLWAGLLVAALGWTICRCRDAVWGAVAGYLSLWSVYWLFKLATGKEGMGYGDFKLLAALGAWLGWKMLLPIILLASVDRRGRRHRA